MIYLASSSPRRRELLEQIGVPHQILKISIDETQHPKELPADYVQRLAAEKAQAGWQYVLQHHLTQHPVLGADTTVICNNKILGKPQDKKDAIAMLSLLSGREHIVMTAVSLVFNQQINTALSQSTVTFRNLTSTEIEHYWHTGEPQDKAGAYAVQGFGAAFIKQLNGSYSGVMGLPLFETSQLLEKFDLPFWQTKDGAAK